MDLINVFVRINPSGHYFGQKLSSDLFILDSYICGDEMVLEFMKPSVSSESPRLLGEATNISEKLKDKRRSIDIHDISEKLFPSAQLFAEVHPDEMPQFIEYVDDGSGWDKDFATAWSCAEISGELQRVGEIQVFFGVEGNWDHYT